MIILNNSNQKKIWYNIFNTFIFRINIDICAYTKNDTLVN